MKIIATSDWHIGNFFHTVDRLPEHKHFLQWLGATIKDTEADALLVAGDVFDNANPSAAAQQLYYRFLADITERCPTLRIVITAGNHDSAHRLEAPAAILSRHRIEVRGAVHRTWKQEEGGGHWEFDIDHLIIPLSDKTGTEQAVVIAVPFLRSEVMHDGSYSAGVNALMRQLTDRARELHPGTPLVMMAHMYAKGADIAARSSEKIVIGGQEEVELGSWDNHPDHLTCGHIHKRQHIWNTSWARYTGSVMPMSFAERDYHHGVDLITIGSSAKPQVEFLEYAPQHRLVTIPQDLNALPLKELKKEIKKALEDRTDGQLDETSVYLELKLESSSVTPSDRSEIEQLVAKKNAVLCRIEQVLPDCGVTAMEGGRKFASVDDVLERDPMEAISECFVATRGHEPSEEQKRLVTDIINKVKTNEEEE